MPDKVNKYNVENKNLFIKYSSRTFFLYIKNDKKLAVSYVVAFEYLRVASAKTTKRHLVTSS